MRFASSRRRILEILPWTAIPVVAGCSQAIDPKVPEPIRSYVDPEFGRPYLLYRPSSYNAERAWPLVVACAASFPDSPNRQIRAWDQFAESPGFLVLAPELGGKSKSDSSPASKHLERQRNDESQILAALQHVRGAHSISEDRIFIHGSGAGAAAALRTGLLHPELFRAVTLTDPRFDEAFLTDAGGGIDPYQPVQVCYKGSDAVTGKDGGRCVEWLRAHGADVRDDSIGPRRSGDLSKSLAFLEDICRRPWVRIRAFPQPNAASLDFQFKLQCSFVPKAFRWEFGDGDTSPVAQPIHRYAAPGTYVVSVAVDEPGGKTQARTLRLRVQ